MRKLVELHKEFVKLNRDYKIIYYDIENKCFCFDCCDSFYDFSKGSEQLLISKEYGFIKWLVENEKIDFEGKLNTFRFNSLVDQTLDSYYALLMLLSIQDEPIEFLVSILN